jgi:hypothetical protein
MEHHRQYCEVDDFYKLFCEENDKSLVENKGFKKTRNRKSLLSQSEIPTILINFQSSGFREFKKYYLYLRTYSIKAFPNLLSYTRFIQLVPKVLVLITAYLRSKMSECSGVSFLDSTSLEVCHIKREHSHKVFDGIAKKGKTTTGWFFGLKVHTTINHKGEILSVKGNPGNVDDRVPVLELCDKLFGKLFADKGYISKNLTQELLQKGILLVTKLKKNMKQKLILLTDKLLLKKRAVIESVFDQLKNILQLEHSRGAPHLVDTDEV